MKRLLDIALALLLLPFALTLVAFAAVAIKLDSRGPALFKQVRVGKDRRPFTMFKLRTMQIGTAQRASHEIGSTQITRVGRWLRRTKIDELPQLLSVLQGHMSFVGPRPCLPAQHELVAERDARGVFSVRPGITGRAQLTGIDMSSPRELAEADAAYVADQSLSGDICLIIRTALGRGSGDTVR